MRGAFAVAVSLLSRLVTATPFNIGLPHDASEDGYRIDEMLHVTTDFVALLFTIMIVWMLWSILRKQPALYDHGADRKSWRWTLLISALIFFVVDGHLFISSTLALNQVFGNFAAAEETPGAVRIEINAHQWAWNARYAGPDGEFNTQDDAVTLNDVVIPQGLPVIFQVTSTDVIHGFNVPNMRMKVDAVPGTVNRMWFRARETGRFEIVCAQHCGANHYKMRGVVTVLPREDWERWMRIAATNSARLYDPADAESHWGWSWTEHARTP